ncbi:MAG: ATP synthase F1 subunit delta [Fimbriimonadales bacterium]|nr:ATP synthase F1 subunit delta [Fimbriimonadales bacterium]
MDARIAQRYAKAAFAAAAKVGAVREVEAELDALAEMFSRPGAWRDWLLSPRVARDAKIQRLPEVLGGRAHPLTVALLALMLRKGRQQELPAVAEAFRELRRESERVVHAQVVSARELDERERAELVESLQRRVGKQVEPTFATDPSLLGGVRVSIDNTVLDGTVRGSLRRLRRILETDVLIQV